MHVNQFYTYQPVLCLSSSSSGWKYQTVGSVTMLINTSDLLALKYYIFYQLYMSTSFALVHKFSVTQFTTCQPVLCLSTSFTYWPYNSTHDSQFSACQPVYIWQASRFSNDFWNIQQVTQETTLTVISCTQHSNHSNHPVYIPRMPAMVKVISRLLALFHSYIV